MAQKQTNPLRLIRMELHNVERDRNVKVLQSCAVGSRALGLQSPHSDHDVRFVYCRPVSSYIGLSARRDVIDRQDLRPVEGLDLSGWDIIKALDLASDSNPQVLEWLRSPVQYHGVRSFCDELLEVAGEFNARRVMGFYVSAADRQTRTGAKGSSEDVLAKRYVYAVRPILNILSLSVRPEVLPPMPFDELRYEVRFNTDVRALGSALDDLVAVRRSGDVTAMSAPIPAVQAFIDRMVPVVKELAKDGIDERSPDMMRLEDMCRRTIRAFS